MLRECVLLLLECLFGVGGVLLNLVKWFLCFTLLAYFIEWLFRQYISFTSIIMHACIRVRNNRAVKHFTL